MRAKQKSSNPEKMSDSLFMTQVRVFFIYDANWKEMELNALEREKLEWQISRQRVNHAKLYFDQFKA